MSKIKDPKEKKRLSLIKDHRILIADSNSRERAGVVRKVKRRGKKLVREQARLSLRSHSQDPEMAAELIETPKIPGVRRIAKNSAVTLGQYLDADLRKSRHDLRSISPIRRRNRK